MGGLGGDGHTDGKVLRRHGRGPGTAALVTTPVQQDIFHLHAALQLGSGVTIVGDEHISIGHGPAQRRADGLLTEGRGVGTDLTGTLQGDTFLIKHAHQIHLAVEVQQQLGGVHPAGQLAQWLPLIIQITGKGNLHR